MSSRTHAARRLSIFRKPETSVEADHPFIGAACSPFPEKKRPICRDTPLKRSRGLGRISRRVAFLRLELLNGKPNEVQTTLQVYVRDNNVDQALRALKKKMQREGLFREMKRRRHFEKPSQRRKRERAEAVRRYRKLLRKRMEREGF